MASRKIRWPGSGGQNAVPWSAASLPPARNVSMHLGDEPVGSSILDHPSPRALDIHSNAQSYSSLEHFSQSRFPAASTSTGSLPTTPAGKLPPAKSSFTLTTAILSSAKMAATGASIASDGEHPLRGWTRPEEWSNDDRMHFLMSPYPPGKFPSLEDPKFKFWSRLIHSSSCEMRKLTFSLSDVNERFERNSLRPKCLREVVQLMERQGLVVQLERYEQRLREQTDGLVSWSVGLLARPLSWAWRYMTDASGSVSPIHGRFIIVDRLQELCSTVVAVQHAKVLYKSTDLIISTEELDQLCRGADLDTSDARIVKMEMEKQRLIAVGNNDQGVKIVKFASSTNHKISSPLTDVDYGILMLKRTVKQLKEQVKQSTAAAEMYYAQAKAEVKAKRRAQACQLLRKQKLHKKKSEQQQQMLDNLEQILCRIQQAETDTMVMEAYTGGLKAMKAARQAQPLSKEELEDVMDQLQDRKRDQAQKEEQRKRAVQSARTRRGRMQDRHRRRRGRIMQRQMSCQCQNHCNARKASSATLDTPVPIVTPSMCNRD